MVPPPRNEGNRSKGTNPLSFRDRILAKVRTSGAKPKSNTQLMDGKQAIAYRSRVFWTPSQDRTLLNLMVEHIRSGDKSGNGFKKDAWKHMQARFNSKFNRRYDVQQLKYRLKFYKNQYKVVKSFIDRDGFSWDSDTRSVIAENSAWEEYLAVNPSGVRYKHKPWPFYEEWCKICDPSTTGDQIAIMSQPDELEDEGMIDAGIEAGLVGLDDSPVGSPIMFEEFEKSQHPSEQDGRTKQHIKSPPARPLRYQYATRSQEGEEATGLKDALNNIADAIRFRGTQRAESKMEQWPVERCIEELNAIEGLEEDLFMKALVVFRDEYNRRVFLATKGDQRVNWLKVITS